MDREIKKVKFEAKHPLQIEVVELSVLTKKFSEAISFPHRTNFYHVFLFENCNLTHIVDFNPIQIKPYTLLFIDKDRVHQFDYDSLYYGKVIIFTDEFFCNSNEDSKFLKSTILFNDLTGEASFRIDKTTFSMFLKICDEINEELKMPVDNANQNILKNLLHNFLLFAEREKRRHGFVEMKKGADLDFTLGFKDCLEKNFKTAKNVRFYSEILNITEKRLWQSTTKILGKNPKEIIDERLILEAKRLLVYSSQSIKEIGLSLGFEESTNFIKYFRKHNNKAPTEFRADYSNFE
ncbi:MAG: AraC family transcriptional regulator [Bacteroidetes bacterium]|nr:AraC family transcriptional regulator [Bacteroidota bacterium]